MSFLSQLKTIGQQFNPLQAFQQKKPIAPAQTQAIQNKMAPPSGVAFTAPGYKVPATPTPLLPTSLAQNTQKSQNLTSVSSPTQGMPQVPTTPQMSPQNAQMNAILESMKTTLGGISGSLGSLAAPQAQSTQPTGIDWRRIEDALISAQSPSQEEQDTEKTLSNLLASKELGLANVADKPIAMPFIVGQQAAIERRAGVQAQPLQSRLAQLQSKRAAALDVAKTQLDIAGKKQAEQEARNKPIELSAGSTLYDPVTGKTIYQAPKTPTAPTTMETSQGIMQWNQDTGKWESTGFTKPGESGGSSAQTVSAYADAVLSGKTKLENIPADYRGAVAQAIVGKSITPEASPYLAGVARQGRQAVQGLLKIAESNPEIFGRTAAAPIPGFLRSDAFRNYEGQVEFLKGNIIPAALTAMREASKTGGALGQVSDREGAWLASSLGALAMTQEPSVVIAQLKLVDESLQRWQDAVDKYGGESSTDGTPSAFQLKDGTIVTLQPDGTYK